MALLCGVLSFSVLLCSVQAVHLCGWAQQHQQPFNCVFPYNLFQQNNYSNNMHLKRMSFTSDWGEMSAECLVEVCVLLLY